MSKTLVAFFSATGITAKLAQSLATEIHADLYEIKPETPYTAKDLNWVNPLSRTMKEYVGKTKVAIAGTQRSMDEYDTVILGFPIHCRQLKGLGKFYKAKNYPNQMDSRTGTRLLLSQIGRKKFHSV